MREPLLLLIEDSADDVALAKRAVEKGRTGTQMQVAMDGREALGVLQAGDSEIPKAIFLDLNLPGWNGFEVLSRIRQHNTTKHIPVVILSTSSQHSDIQRSYELGANSFVTKPLDFAEFTQVFGAMSRYWLDLNSVGEQHTARNR